MFITHIRLRVNSCEECVFLNNNNCLLLKKNIPFYIEEVIDVHSECPLIYNDENLKFNIQKDLMVDKKWLLKD